VALDVESHTIIQNEATSMSFNFPANIQQDIQQYAQAEHISPDAAATKLVQLGLKTIRRKTKGIDLVTDEQISRLKALDSSFGLLEDVPEENIDRMSATIRRMKREGFGARA
jgi:hypothetical protein